MILLVRLWSRPILESMEWQRDYIVTNSCHLVSTPGVWCKYSNGPYDIVIKKYYG